MVPSTPNPSDEVIYPGGAIDLTHPGHLAMMAELFGMAPAPVERCRVLELGCSAGNNLLPLAELFPEATFVGVDRSPLAIAQGRAWADRIGVTNLTFVEADLASYDPGPSTFDYVVAHGLYSWVPDAVRDRVMAIFARAMTPHGVAYVSYDALPGSHARRAMRDMMLFHTRGLHDPSKRVAQGRALTTFLAGAVPDGAGSYKAIVVEQRDQLATFADDYIVHDQMAEHNDPFYFHQVVEHAASHGLAYLSDARFSDMSDRHLPPAVREVLRGVGDVVSFMQYLDFVQGRSFRHTLLVRDGVALERGLDGRTVRRAFVVSASKPESAEPDLASPAVLRFVNSRNVRLSLTSPLAKAAMTILAASAPRAFAFDELLAAARDRVGSTGEHDASQLGQLLVAALDGDMVKLSAHRPRMAASPGDRPRATRLAREQAAAGGPIAMLDHQNLVDVDPFVRQLITLLDGTRDRAALAAAWRTGAGESGPVEATLAKLVLDRLILG